MPCLGRDSRMAPHANLGRSNHGTILDFRLYLWAHLTEYSTLFMPVRPSIPSITIKFVMGGEALARDYGRMEHCQPAAIRRKDGPCGEWPPRFDTKGCPVERRLAVSVGNS